MPRLNGTGPQGYGPMTGRGMGPCGCGMRRGAGFFGQRNYVSPKNNLSYLESEKSALEEELSIVNEEISSLKEQK